MKKAFVIGHPINHSVSPVIHGYWLKKLGIEGTYEKFDVTPEDLPAFLARVRAGEFVGGNITLPHKVAAFDACDQLSEGALAIGAVNTLVAENGELEGLNTDIIGFLASLDVEQAGWDTHPGEAVVLGAGGAARAIVKGLVDRGFTRIRIVNRTLANAVSLHERYPETTTAHGLDELPELAGGANLLVNATKIELSGTGFEFPFVHILPEDCIVYDIVYGSDETALLVDARRQGLRTVGGVSMVMHQAVEGFRRWFGVKPTVDDELRAVIDRHHK